MKRARSLAVFVSLLLLVGCASKTRTLVLTGEALDAIGKSFVETGQMYNDLFRVGKLTEHEYRDWALFARRFQAAYAAAVKSWKTGLTTDDTVELVLSLKRQLVQYLLFAQSRAQ